MAELYTFHQRDDLGVPSRFWRYTSGPRSVVVEHETFLPKAIRGGDWLAEHRDGKAKLEVPADLEPFPLYLAGDPGSTLWVNVSMTSGVPLFTGKVLSVEFRLFKRRAIVRMSPTADLASSDYPTRNYDPSCDWNLFDVGCGLSAALFSKSLASSGVALDDGGLTFTHVGLATRADGSQAPDGYWMHGFLATGLERRLITSHSGSTVSLLSRFVGAIEPTFTVWPGCNKGFEECRDKFANLANYGGFRRVPTVNPFVDGFARR